MKDMLGARMKEQYESRAETSLMRRCYTIIRIDGRSFTNYCRGLEKPFDDGLMEDMDATAQYLCKNIMGAKFAFIQSDEISLMLTDFDSNGTQAWLDYGIQKMCSISASMATSKFNELRLKRYGTITKFAEFDSRVFQIADRTEVFNYFHWRQKDTTRNSISSTAQSMYSPRELHSKNSDQKQEMIFQKGTNWNDFAPRYKRGRMIIREMYEKETESNGKSEPSLRSRWVVSDVPVFTQEREFLLDLIPLLESFKIPEEA